MCYTRDEDLLFNGIVKVGIHPNQEFRSFYRLRIEKRIRLVRCAWKTVPAWRHPRYQPRAINQRVSQRSYTPEIDFLPLLRSVAQPAISVSFPCTCQLTSPPFPQRMPLTHTQSQRERRTHANDHMTDTQQSMSIP